MKVEFQDKIDNYLLNRMSGEARRAFEQEMEQDKELWEQMEFTKNVQAALKSRNEKLVQMQEWQEEMDEEVVEAGSYRAIESDHQYCPMPAMENQAFPTSPFRKKRHLIYWLSGIVAIFLVGLFLLPINIIHESKPVPIEYGTFRGGRDYPEIKRLIGQTEYKKAILAIEKEECLLEQELLINKKDTTNRERQKYDSMLIEMKQDELMWLKVHVLLGLGKEEEAMCLLDRLRETDNEYRLAADSLYNQLKR